MPKSSRKRKLRMDIEKKDCIAGMKYLHADFTPPHLIFADPPYNIGKKYKNYDDRKPQEQYLLWCTDWIQVAYDTLDKNGSLWVAINDEYACDFNFMATRSGFYRQNWIIWYYTFGVACQKRFSRSHTHLFHFTKQKQRFTFNADEVRVPSARQTEYADKRANAKGKLPDNTWILRPQEAPDTFQPLEDTWFFNRVCGTYNEREKHSPNQMPLALMERIILVSSNPGDLVCDPFGGTFTTAVAAAKHGRDFCGFDISAECCKKGRARVKRELQ